MTVGQGWRSAPAVAAQVVAAAVLVMVLTWSLHFRGGVAWSQPVPLIFNWHPILMVLGLVILPSEAVMAYRLLPFSKVTNKKVHLTLQGTALVLGIIGVSAALRNHNKAGIPNFYSLHSWLGLITLTGFTLQWLSGLVVFLHPGCVPEKRAAMLPWHMYFGGLLYALALATAALGTQEKLAFLEAFPPPIDRRSAEAVMAQIMAILFFVLGGLVMFVLTRLPKSEMEYGRLIE
eukprot:jgi/Chlat1/2312/Chrsp17S02599